MALVNHEYTVDKILCIGVKANDIHVSTASLVARGGANNQDLVTTNLLTD